MHALPLLITAALALLLMAWLLATPWLQRRRRARLRAQVFPQAGGASCAGACPCCSACRPICSCA